ncbi:MAG: hypothetical protein U0797_06870 [Gemmataceae bacterium]
MLRDHAPSKGRCSIDTKKTATIDTPDAFKDEIKGVTIEVPPLARGPGREAPAGLVHLHYEHGGALNSK